MIISVKSEVDSRNFVYPAISVLKSYGSVMLFTSNNCANRLIDGEESGGFRDVQVCVVPDGDVDQAIAQTGWSAQAYDFTIFDNLGYADCDKLIIPVANAVSQDFIDELLFLVSDPTAILVKFGTPGKKAKKAKEKPVKKSAKNVKGSEATPEEVEEDPLQGLDPEFNKWRLEKSDQELLDEAISSKDAAWVPWISFADVEEVECKHNYIMPSDAFLNWFYNQFKETFLVDQHMFRKECKKNDSGDSFTGVTIG